MTNPMNHLDMRYTDGTTVVNGRKLPEHLWENLTEEQEGRFAEAVNERFTPWEVLEYCDPGEGRLWCGRVEFFEDWVTDMMMYRDDRLKEIFGFEVVE